MVSTILDDIQKATRRPHAVQPPHSAFNLVHLTVIDSEYLPEYDALDVTFDEDGE